MKLKKFEINDFRSIRNTKCEVSPKITILAGKNESGKTNIIEALEITQNNEKYSEFDKPFGLTDTEPKVILTFNLEEKDFDIIKIFLKKIDITTKIIIDFLDDINDKSILVTEHIEKNKFAIAGNLYTVIKNMLQALVFDKVLKYNNELKIIKEKYPDLSNKEVLRTLEVKEDKTLVDEILEFVNKSSLLQLKESHSIQDLEQLIRYLTEITELRNAIEKLPDEFYNLIPTFILYSSFDDIIPYSVPIDKIRDKAAFENEYRIVKDLFNLANLDIEVFDSNNEQLRSIAVKSASLECSKDFSKFWNQNPIEITFEDKGDKICIWVNDKGDEDGLLRPNQRSKGLQWYMAFFVRLRSMDEDNSIILIDEPGANLHATAQDDVLVFLEDITNKNQIIFTTHSPFLIDADNLQRIRLIEKSEDSKNTRIENNFNKGSDYDTLTPIIAKIGLDLSKTLTFSTEMNILLEGVSDYYYLTSILNYLKKKEKYEFPSSFGFIPAIGHTQISHLISIIIGWGLDYLILLDKKGTKKTYNRLIREGIDELRIILVGETDKDSIEDLFSDKDKKKYNLDDFSSNKKKTHVEEKLSKSLIAKQFAQKTLDDDFELTKITQGNFKKLFETIQSNIKEIKDQNM